MIAFRAFWISILKAVFMIDYSYLFWFTSLSTDSQCIQTLFLRSDKEVERGS